MSGVQTESRLWYCPCIAGLTSFAALVWSSSFLDRRGGVSEDLNDCPTLKTTRPTSRNRKRNVTLLPEIIKVMLIFLSGQVTSIPGSHRAMLVCNLKRIHIDCCRQDEFLPFSAHIRHRIQYLVSLVTEKIPPNGHFADKRHGFRSDPVGHDSRLRCHQQ